MLEPVYKIITKSEKIINNYSDLRLIEYEILEIFKILTTDTPPPKPLSATISPDMLRNRFFQIFTSKEFV